MAYDGSLGDNDGLRPRLNPNQAKVLSTAEYAKVEKQAKKGEYWLRNIVGLQLSHKLGLRACEIANLEWSRHVLDASGEVADEVIISDDIAKGGGVHSRSGRVIPVEKDLKRSLKALRALRPDDKHVFHPLIGGGSQDKVSPNAVTQFFKRLYKESGLVGATSHSGRRTFITTKARQANLVGCSIRDVQAMAGHSKLSTTQAYVEVAPLDNRRRLVDLH